MRINFIGGGADGLRIREGSQPSAVPSSADLADRIQHITAAELDTAAATELHDALTQWRALAFADDLSAELRRRALPRTGLRALGRRLAEHGTHRDPVKIGLLLLGLGGNRRDRELLLLLGTLDELTLFAAIALSRSQSDADTAVHTLAQRVTGWGRINAVRRLQGTTDPATRAWLLREGFRHTVMNEYLAHLAATTGRLHDALTAPHVDQQLLDGAGLAHRRSRERANQPQWPKPQTDVELRTGFQAKLDLEGSPEQITACLRILWPKQPQQRLRDGTA